MMDTRRDSARDMALALVEAGIGVAPILPTGRKRPPFPWKEYQTRRATPHEIRAWYRAYPGAGVAALCGAISGNHEVIDIDDPALVETYKAIVERLAGGLLASLVEVRTPKGGAHLHYRHGGVTAPGRPLARRLVSSDDVGGGGTKIAPLIETRGQGNLVMCPGSPPACHPLRRPYELMRGDLTHLPLIAVDHRMALMEAGRILTEYTPPVARGRPRPGVPPPALIAPATPAAGTMGAVGDRPGDRYNAGADWHALLEPHGWRALYAHGSGGQQAGAGGAGGAGGVTYWVKPGSDPRDGHHATTGHDGHNTLYVFSTAASPFEPDRGYTPFTAYALLNHGGAVRAAAAALAARGYGDHSDHGDERDRAWHEDEDPDEPTTLPAPRYVGSWRRRVAAVALPVTLATQAGLPQTTGAAS